MLLRMALYDLRLRRYLGLLIHRLPRVRRILRVIRRRNLGIFEKIAGNYLIIIPECPVCAYITLKHRPLEMGFATSYHHPIPNPNLNPTPTPRGACTPHEHQGLPPWTGLTRSHNPNSTPTLTPTSTPTPTPLNKSM